MYISYDYTQNYPFCRLKLVGKTFGHSTKWTSLSQRLLSQRTRKRYCKTLGTSEINSPMSPPSARGITLPKTGTIHMLSWNFQIRVGKAFVKILYRQRTLLILQVYQE